MTGRPPGDAQGGRRPARKLVGRAEELRLVRTALMGGGCVISGPAGVGKSRLAWEAAELESDIPPIRVLATAASSAIPFAAFAAILPPVDLAGGPLIAACLASLRDRTTSKPPVVVVDDGHLLDQSSAALAHALGTSGAARLAITVRRGEPVHDAITSLWKEYRLERVELEPLSRRDTHDLVERVIDPPVHPEVHEQVFSLTHGNPMFVLELLADARATGSVSQRQGRWVCTGAPMVGERLRDLVGARLARLDDGARPAVELVAAGGPLPIEVVTTLTSSAALERCERDGLLAVDDAGATALVDFVHPLYGEVIGRGLPVSVLREARRAVAASFENRGPLSPEDRLRVASWRLDAGVVDGPAFVRASRLALARGSAELALRLADAADEGFESRLVGAAARRTLNRFGEVEEQLAPLEEAAQRAPVETAAAYLRTRAYSLHWGGADGAVVLELLGRARSWHASPAWATTVASIQGWIVVDHSRPAAALDLVVPLLDRGLGDPQAELDLLLIAGLAYSRRGRVAECERLEPRILDLVSTLGQGAWETGWAAAMVDGAVRVDAGRDLPALRQRFSARRRAAIASGDRGLAAAHAVILGRIALVRGHLGEAVHVLTDAADDLARTDPRNARGLALAYLARAHAQKGHAELASEVLAQARAARAIRPNNLRLKVELGRAEAWTAAAAGRLTESRDAMWRVVELAEEDLLGAAEATYGALRLGAPAPECARRLVELSASFDNDLALAKRDHAVAMAADDGGRQLESARQLEALGADLLAAEAAAGAARALNAAGRTRTARGASAMAQRLRARCPEARTPALHLLPATEDLTARERETAVLAARGESNAAIADALNLSVRTVETYLLRACGKLGVRGRHELGSVLRAADPS